MRRAIQLHQPDLLNVTIRTVETDSDSMLRYADQPMYCFVLLFSQQRSSEGERKMRSLTNELVDAALQQGGRYYLPYRLHATADQFRRAYPQASRFAELKRKYDPDERFQNKFWVQYWGRP